MRGSFSLVSKGAITPLVDALNTLGLDGEIALGGRWVILRGERCAVYVIQAATGGYFTWCDDPTERAVKAFSDPREAILAGLQRAIRKEGAIDIPPH